MRLAIVVLAVLFAGCGPSLDHGIVTAKHDNPAYDSTYLQPILISEICSGGKIVTCTPIYTYIPETIHHPESWTFDLKGNEGATGTVNVSAAQFAQYQVGGNYP